MGDDGETFSSSEFHKPSFEGASEQQQHAIGEEKLNGGELNDAEQCEFVPKSGDSNVSPFDLKERERLAEAEAEAEEKAGQGGVEETGDMHGEDDVEDNMGEEAEVGGGGEGPVLREKVGGENSDFTGVDEAVMNEEGHVEVVTVQTGAVVAAEEVEEVVDTVEFKEGATSGGARENSDSDMGIIVERSHDTVVDEAEAVVEGERLITESDNLQSTAADGSGTVEEDAETVATPVESSLVMTGPEKEVESAEGKETNVEEMLTDEVKVDVEAVIEVTEKESNAQNVTGLRGLEFVGVESSNLPKGGMNRMGGKEGVVADTEMDDMKGTEDLENFRSNDLQYNGQESVIEANKEWLPLRIPVADSVLEEGKEAVTEASKVGNIESIRKQDDADFAQQDDEDEEMVAEEESAVADMGMETETDVVEERRLLGTGKEPETETVAVDDVESINTDDAKLVPQDEDKKIVANEEPALIGSEMETKTGAGEEPRVLVLDQGEEAETEIAEVGDVVSASKTDDAKLVSLDEEDGEMVAEEGSALAGMEMETQTRTGEEQRLILEKEKEAETETAEVDNVEYTPEIDDTKHVPQDEGDEEMAAEESALADTEMETETDVGESSRAVGEKHKRGRNSKVLTNSKTFSKARKTMEEDVCFICFDGGDLVLCDRR